MDQTFAAPDPKEMHPSYRVLARKYRPRTFDDLVGQDAMVRILRAAFETQRVAHAYMLTGVRGVGKTTTARLLARALNYTDAEGRSTPSLDFSVPGKNCEDILEGQHMDVLEMDAASRTSIEDVREIIESAKFRPAIGAYKVYIIDEVHMLSKAAFNGLLKILEEPPPHVKFIFATTEIRKVPVTILSRCQRFDLKRIEPDKMIAHLKSVCAAENAAVDDNALALITRAAEGSVRDALSLLDQAIAQGLATGDGAEPIRSGLVREMLGLADRERVLDLLDLMFKGDTAAALGELQSQYDLGADPLEVLRDLLDLTNWLTRLKLLGDAVQDGSVSDTQMTRGRDMVTALHMNTLSRAWQILLKGLNEAQTAPRPFAATEMVLVRFCYAANLPAPDVLIRQMEASGAPNGTAPRGGDGKSEGTGDDSRQKTPRVQAAPAAARPAQPEHDPYTRSRSTLAPRMEAHPLPAAPDHEPVSAPPAPDSFDDVVALIAEKRDLHLLHDVERHVHLVHFDRARIEFRPAAEAPDNLPGRLSQALEKWTGRRWVVSISNAQGAPTLAERREETQRALEAKMRDLPLVKTALDLFPDAKIVRVEEREIEPFAEDEIDDVPETAMSGDEYPLDNEPDYDDPDLYDPADEFD